DGLVKRCVGGTRLGGGERPQLHESGAGGDDGSVAARAGVSSLEGNRASYGAHFAASRCVSVRLRGGRGGGGSAERVYGDQCESGAAGSFGDVDSHGQSQGLQVCDLDGCASSEASRQYELRSTHGAARVAGGGRHP